MAATQAVSHDRVRKNSIPSRPTTPLRPASRTSFRASQTTPASNVKSTHSTVNNDFPLQHLEPAFAELSDSMADLEANFMHLQLLNESMARFNENFAAFLYGLNMTAFCVDFPEAPIQQSFARHGSNTCQLDASPFPISRPQAAEGQHQQRGGATNNDAAPDATFLTTDTSFVENPPMSTKSSASAKYTSAGSSSARQPATSRRGMTSGRASSSSRGRVAVAGTDASGRRITRLPATGRGNNMRGGVSGRGRGRT